VKYYKSVVVTITVTCYLWAPSNGDHFLACGGFSKPPHFNAVIKRSVARSYARGGGWC